MELSRFTDYALRSLIYVGLHEDSLATIDGIAVAHAISRHHVVKVVHRLAVDGFLVTYRGRGGGLELGREPERIRVGDVVRATESIRLAECFDPDNRSCRIVGSCRLKGALQRAREAFLASLDEQTLADLLVPQRELSRSLGLVR